MHVGVSSFTSILDLTGNAGHGHVFVGNNRLTESPVLRTSVESFGKEISLSTGPGKLSNDNRIYYLVKALVEQTKPFDFGSIHHETDIDPLPIPLKYSRLYFKPSGRRK